MKKKELEAKIESLGAEIEKLKEAVDFLLIDIDKAVVSSFYTIKYVFDGVLKKTKVHSLLPPHIIEVSNNKIIFKILKNYILEEYCYYSLDKATGNYCDITEYYKEKTEGETEATEQKCECKCKTEKGGKK